MSAVRVTRPRLLAGLAVALAFVLTGCGHTPGAAFSVGDQVVTTKTVDTVVKGECTLVAGQGSATPQSKLVWAVVDAMLQSTIQIAYGDHVGASYDAKTLREQEAQVRAGITKLPAKQREALFKAISDSVKGDLIMVSVGTKLLADKGTAKPSDDEARNAGLQVANAWAKKQGVSVDPRYNLGKTDRPGGGDGSMSKAVSPFAKGAVAGSTQPTFLSGVPKNQICG